MQATVAPECLVRSARASEIDTVISVFHAANVQYAEVLPRDLYDAFMTNVLDVRRRMADSQLFVAELDGRVAGAITYYPDASLEALGWPPHWAGIRTVNVAPAARGRGLGRALVQTCIDRARMQGATGICLHTADFMEAAVAMYERMGFVRCPEYDRDVMSLFVPDATGPYPTAIAYWFDLLA